MFIAPPTEVAQEKAFDDTPVIKWRWQLDIRESYSGPEAGESEAICKTSTEGNGGP
jgi:hypothetical protein